MNKYSVGNKFVIEIEESYENGLPFLENRPCVLYRMKGFNSLVFDKNGLDKLKRLDGDYVNEHFVELHDEAFGEGRNCGIAEALKWNKDNEEDFYNKGLNDAWELAKKISAFTHEGLLEIFDTDNIYCIFNDFTPQECLDAFETYEKEQIKVGDVVRFKSDPETEVLITSAHDNYYFDGVHLQTNTSGRKGDVHSGIYEKDIENTGKRIDISAILAEIGKE